MAWLTFAAGYKDYIHYGETINFGGGLIFDYTLTDNGTTVTLTGQFKLYLAMSSDRSAAGFSARAENNGLEVWAHEGSPSRKVEWVNTNGQTALLNSKGSTTTKIGQQIVRTYTKTKSSQTITLYNGGASYGAQLSLAGKRATGVNAYGNTNQTFTIPALASYAVSYNANGGSGAPTAQTKWYGETLTLSSVKPTRTGYTFAGWNTNNAGTGTNYASGGAYTANGGATLYAKWTANKNSITYNANGGSGAVPAQTKTYDTALTLQNGSQLSRFGELNGAVTKYILREWNTKADGSGTTYALGGAAPNITSDLVLYAIWDMVYIYPSISNLECRRTDTASDSDITLSDEGEYIRISFDYTDYSTDGGTTMQTPSCTVKIGRDTYTPTLSGYSFVMPKPSKAYSRDESFKVVITVFDPNNVDHKAFVEDMIATAILPIDLYGYGETVYMGIMHSYTTHASITQADTFIDGDLYLALDTSAASGTDAEIYDALDVLDWVDEVII